MFGEKLYFKRFIYVSIKIVYFYGIHKSSLPFFFLLPGQQFCPCLFSKNSVSFLITIIFGAGMILLTFCFWIRIYSSIMYIMWEWFTLPVSSVSAWMTNGCTDCIFLAICKKWYNIYAHKSFKMNSVKLNWWFVCLIAITYFGKI